MYGIFMECWVSFKLYFGNPLLAILLVASAIYIIVTEKKWKRRIVLGVLPLVIMVGFLLPITKIVYVAVFNEGSDTYYRIMWLVPMYVVIGYALCKLVFSFQNKMVQRVALVAALAITIVSGSLVYLNQYMSVAENLYHIPQNVIDICDVISPAEGEPRVRAAFPSELVHFVRQYDTDILLPFGREMVVTQWDYYNPVYEVMEKPEIIDAQALIEATRQSSCRYIILSRDRRIDKNLATLGLKLLETVDNYYIYEDPEIAKQG